LTLERKAAEWTGKLDAQDAGGKGRGANCPTAAPAASGRFQPANR
jgi:hypothetical protein